MRLESITYGARDINVYTFVGVDGPLPAAEPGAHLDVEVEPGLIRQYSLLTVGEDPLEYRIGVKRDPAGRGGSVALHDRSVVGAEFAVSPPRTTFPLHPLDGTAGEVLLLAGGIGVTPLLGMLGAVRRAGGRVSLHYWARSLQDMLARAELERDAAVVLHPGGRAAAAVADVVRAAPADAHLYCCGPEGMLEEFEAACAGRDPDRVHVERFVARAPLSSPGRFTVRCARSAVDVEVDPQTSVLDACLKAGVDLEYSCEEGTCGACEVRVLEGAVTHNDTVASAERHDADRTMMVCCSRAAGSFLVIDV
ncbi:PDR/VanB family oxidoreductase [Pseudonocardia ailaonensis]|uniref:PDR/VanB family oxidoreductase n=1 Tax=Pseudonocardia ailaonensis TaxID=367279 RepID=UPI0031D0BC5F